MAEQFLFGFLGTAVAHLAGDPVLHPGIWTILFATFFSTTQIYAALLAITLTAPGLVSEDIRGRTFLLLFSRPLTRWDYILGKLAVPVAAALSVTFLPALFLYVGSLCLVPSWGLLAATWPLLAKALAASLALAFPASFLALFLSSLVRESRYALLLWLAVWLLPSFFPRFHRETDPESQPTKISDSRVHISIGGVPLKGEGRGQWPITLNESIAAANRRCFDVPGVLESTDFLPHIRKKVGAPTEQYLKKITRDFENHEPAGVPWILLGGITLVSFMGLSLRIRGRQLT